MRCRAAPEPKAIVLGAGIAPHYFLFFTLETTAQVPNFCARAENPSSSDIIPLSRHLGALKVESERLILHSNWVICIVCCVYNNTFRGVGT